MIEKIPLTGKIIAYDAKAAQIDGIGISGDPDDPVKPLPLDLHGVGWRLVNIDFENGMAEIDIEAPEKISELKPGGNPNNPKDYTTRNLTAVEKQNILAYAHNVLANTPDQLYAIATARRRAALQIALPELNEVELTRLSQVPKVQKTAEAVSAYNESKTKNQ